MLPMGVNYYVISLFGGISSLVFNIFSRKILRYRSNQSEAPTYEVAERLVMSVDTMLRLYQGLGEVVGQMEGKGLIKKRENEPLKKK